MVDNLSDTDRGLFISCLKSWREIVGNGTPDAESLEWKILVFTLAMNRLTRGRDFLEHTYISAEVPELLGRIMKSFIKGEMSLEETRQQLEYCVAKLEEWRNELNNFLKSP